ncbi:small GTP-binding protein [Histomonas meleagridis]|uniref:small GTP-binding protein n=1 Tax=Histomonas meleagridis TaxID=135588 RepID=UPI0035593A23|nr:small GTP-binding protein [Histomonas meleagridis]KAH0796097.1 small GTP-binding protein [Histomonas meleagridis]
MKEEISFKVVFLGDADVGKTSIINKYLNYNEKIIPTVGATNLKKSIDLNGVSYNLNIMDTAGQERYRTVVPLYLHGANAAVLVTDVSKPESLESIDYWMSFIRENATDISVIVLCCNKIDLADVRAYDSKSIQDKANEYQITYFETSAVSGVGIFKLFEFLISRLACSQAPDVTNLKEASSESSCC